MTAPRSAIATARPLYPPSSTANIGPWEDSVVPGTATAQLTLGGNSLNTYVVIRAGHVTGGSVILGPSARSGGTCTVSWYLNGVIKDTIGIIDGTNTTHNFKTFNTTAISPGDLITVKLTTSSFTPANQALDAFLEITWP